MEYVLPVIIIILIINQNNIFKAKIKTLTDNIQKLNSKLDAISTKQQITPKKATTFDKETLSEKAKTNTLKEETLKTSEDVLKVVTSILDTKKTDPISTNQSKEKNIEVKNTSAPKVTIPVKKRTPKPPKPSLWERFKEKNPDLEKFIGENLINKLGVLILVLGISYFVKYAIDKDWINEPARVGIGILAGSLVLGIAHKLRKKYAPFSSVLVAGAVAIFYFTIAIAFHEYQLFNQTVAFVIMVLVTTFSCFLSLSYNRMELAVLSLIGGFAVPFMISRGSGNYQVLFSYIAILDIGILGIAYFKKWSLVNTLAFIFTSMLYVVWLAKAEFTSIPDESVPYAGALFFAFLFYIIFTITNIINNIRVKGIFSKAQLMLLTTNTFIFYGVGMFILSNFHPEFKGLFTTAVALLNLIYAWFLFKKFGLDKTAVYLLIGLTLTFITLAIPIQFKGNYITLFWSIEAVLLMWLAQKSKIKSYRFGSVIVHILMAISLYIDWHDKYGGEDFIQLIINSIFITGIVAVASLLMIQYLLRNEALKISMFKVTLDTVAYRKIIGILAIILLYVVGILETGYQAIKFYDTKSTAFFFPVMYHLIFTAIFCFILFKKKSSLNYKILNVISIINIIAFAVFFMQIPFFELENNIINAEGGSLAYQLHFLALALIIYFGWLLYKTNKDQLVFEKFNHKAVVWIIAVVIIVITSTELILNGLIIGNPEITTEQLAELSNGSNRKLDYYEKIGVARRNIKSLKFKVIKTGLPVSWGVLSFIFLILGIKKQIKSLRIAALALLGITIVKLFSYDISNVSETGKIVAFILLGVLILIISFVYQKIKVLVIDDTEDSKNDNTILNQDEKTS